MRILASILIALPLPALADDICHDLWFTRNLIMDRAGYCFGSILGKSTFDNGDCTGKSVALGTAATEMVARIQASEKELACKVDTGQPVLDLEDADFRRALTDLPLRSPFESACIGWLGERVPLKAGHRADARTVGEILPGDLVGYAYEPVGSWQYVTVTNRAWRFKSAEWVDLERVAERCEQIAG